MSISDKIVGLRIATRKAAMCESSDSAKNTLSLKTKILYLVRNQDLTPSDIIDRLAIVKTNLAHIAATLVQDGLILKNHNQGDKRGITYSITEKGTKYLERKMDIIERAAKKAFSCEEEYSDAEKKLEDSLNLFDFFN